MSTTAAKLKVAIESHGVSEAVAGLRAAQAATRKAAEESGDLKKAQRATAEALVAAGLAAKDSAGNLRDLRGNTLGAAAAVRLMDQAVDAGEGGLHGLRRSAAGVDRELGQVARAASSADRQLTGMKRAANAADRAMGGLRRTGALTGATLAKTLMPAALAAAGGLGVLAAQAGALGAIKVVSALAPLVGVLGVLPALGAGAGAALGVLAMGVVGLGDAINEEDPEAYAAALAKLPSTAQALVSAIRDVKGGFTGLRMDVQGALLEGMGDAVRDLAGGYLPILSDGLARVAVEMNAVVMTVKDFLLQGRTMDDVRSVLDNVATAIGNSRGAMEPLLGIFRDVTAVGATFLPGLATGFTNAANAAGGFIANARETGALASWIQAGLDTAGQLGQVLGNVGGILGTVLSATSDAGAGLLNTLVGVTGQFDAFLSSEAGGAALTSLLTAAGDATSALMPLIGALLPAAATLVQILASFGTAVVPGITALVEGLGGGLQALVPVAGVVGQALGDAIGGLAPILPVLGQALAQVLPPLMQALDGIIPPLVNVVNALLPALVPIINVLAAVLTPVAELLDQLLTPLLEGLTPVLNQLGAALGPVITALADALGPVIAQVVEALVPFIGQLAEALMPIIGALVPVIGSLGEILGAVLDAVAPLLPPIGDLVVSLAELLAPALELVAGWLAFLVKALEPVLTWVVTIIGVVAELTAQLVGGLADGLSYVKDGVLDWFSTAGDWLRDAGHNIIDGLVNGLKDFASRPFEALGDIGSSMLSGFKNLFGIHSPSRVLAQMGRFLMTGLAGGITGGLGGVRSAWKDAQDIIAMSSPSFTIGSTGWSQADLAAAAVGAGTVASSSSSSTVVNMPITVNIPAGTSAADSATISSDARTAVYEALSAAASSGVLALAQRGR